MGPSKPEARVYTVGPAIDGCFDPSMTVTGVGFWHQILTRDLSNLILLSLVFLPNNPNL